MAFDLCVQLDNARHRGITALDEPTGKAILAAAGIRVPRSFVVGPDDDLHAAVSALEPPYALKLVAQGVVHKTEVGGVRLGLRDAAELSAARADMWARLQAQGLAPDAWLVEEMVPPGAEVVVGGVMDPEFGPMVMVGLGGVFVEVLHDVAFRICPIVARDATEMIDELRGAPLLRGARGREPASIKAIVDVLLRVGDENGLLLQCAEQLADIDINPLIVGSETAFAADARFILRQPG